MIPTLSTLLGKSKPVFLKKNLKIEVVEEANQDHKICEDSNAALSGFRLHALNPSLVFPREE